MARFSNRKLNDLLLPGHHGTVGNKRGYQGTMNKRELGTVLAALRLWQEHYGSCAKVAHWVDIATDDGKFEPLSPKEIDGLCEKLNTEVKGER